MSGVLHKIIEKGNTIDTLIAIIVLAWTVIMPLAADIYMTVSVGGVMNNYKFFDFFYWELFSVFRF